MQFWEILTTAPKPPPPFHGQILNPPRVRIKMGGGDYGPTILKKVHKQKSPLPTKFLNLKSPRTHGRRIYMVNEANSESQTLGQRVQATDLCSAVVVKNATQPHILSDKKLSSSVFINSLDEISIIS